MTETDKLWVETARNYARSVNAKIAEGVKQTWAHPEDLPEDAFDRTELKEASWALKVYYAGLRHPTLR